MTSRSFPRLAALALGAILLLPAVGAAQQQPNMLDLNTATRDQLLAFEGIGQLYADKIIAARPFKMRSELVSRNIMSATEYLKIKRHLTPTSEDAAVEAAAQKAMDMGPGPLRDRRGRLNLNAASKEDLLAVEGIGEAYADKVLAGRPYKATSELVSRNVMPVSAFEKIKDKVFVIKQQ